MMNCLSAPNLRAPILVGLSIAFLSPCFGEDRSLLRGDLVVLGAAGALYRADAARRVEPILASPPWEEGLAVRVTPAGDIAVLVRSAGSAALHTIAPDPPHARRAIAPSADLPVCSGFGFAASGEIVLVRGVDGALVRVFPDGTVASDPPILELVGADGVYEIPGGWVAWSASGGWIRAIGPEGAREIASGLPPIDSLRVRADGTIFVLAGDPPRILRLLASTDPPVPPTVCASGAAMAGARALACWGDQTFAVTPASESAWRVLAWRGCVGPGPRGMLPAGFEPIAMDASRRAPLAPGDLVFGDLGFLTGIPAVRAWRPFEGRVRTLWAGEGLFYPSHVAVGFQDDPMICEPREDRLLRLVLDAGPVLSPLATAFAGIVQTFPRGDGTRLLALGESVAIGGVYSLVDRTGAVEALRVGGSLLGCTGVAAIGERIYAASSTNGAIWALESGGPRRLAGGFAPPARLAIDPSGAALLADPTGACIWRVTWEGALESVRRGEPFRQPDAVCADPDGTIWVSDPAAGAIFLVRAGSPTAVAMDGTLGTVDAPAGIDRARARPLARVLLVSLGSSDSSDVLAASLVARRIEVARAVAVPDATELESYRAVFVSAPDGSALGADAQARLVSYRDAVEGAALYIEAGSPPAEGPLLESLGFSAAAGPEAAGPIVALDPDRSGSVAGGFPDPVRPAWAVLPGEGGAPLLASRDGDLPIAALVRGEGFQAVVSSLPFGQVVEGWASTRDDLAEILLRSLLGGLRALVFRPGDAEGGAVDAAEALASSLEAAWLAVDRTTHLPDAGTLDGYDLVAVSLGAYPRSATMSAADAEALRLYLVDGVGGAGLYLEGGEFWIDHPRTVLHAYFDVAEAEDGARQNAYGEMEGRRTSVADASDLRFPGPWRADAGPANRIFAARSGEALLVNREPSADTMILTDHGFFRTIGSNAVLGGLGNTAAGSREEMAAVIAQALTHLPPPPRFVRGDANDTGRVDIADVVAGIHALFGSGAACACQDACDANDDGKWDVADPIYVAQYLFAHEAPPPAPFPECGADPTPDEITCAVTSCP
ncbi:MAG: hypothetical protein JXP34_25075 [Planctomycetes bacterium]|nr:hypothetical protein [Planctomycetota bacterium]